jgi:hypothetical protein
VSETSWRLCVPLRLCVKLQSVHYSDDAIFYERHIEIDQQPKALIRQPKISQQLLLMNRGQRLNGLNLNDHFPANNQICAKPELEVNVLPDDWDSFLALYIESTFPEFALQNGFVDRFKDSGAEPGVNLEGDVYDAFCDLFSVTVSRKDASQARVACHCKKARPAIILEMDERDRDGSCSSPLESRCPPSSPCPCLDLDRSAGGLSWSHVSRCDGLC